ncbi:hypothetical protein OSB04_011079 [Centaurea solstitialis]|uniref:DUF8039 domain-containing protein n=1 Tax=Centaurea solstitialis TaxID=347529 RepID=A0AA38TKH3_9ASTR|nr:hypothetical protein OSB04_011079 [Centaurea solstitialis]
MVTPVVANGRRGTGLGGGLLEIPKEEDAVISTSPKPVPHQQDHWNIKDDKYRDSVLKVANHSWKNFKKSLRRKFLKTGRNPCDVYPYLDHKAWAEFCVNKTTKEFLKKSDEGKKNALLATNLARLGARGYRSMRDPWKIEGKDPGELSKIFGLKDPRARDFLLARRVKGANGRKIIPTYLQPLADEIIEKDNQVSEGLWVPGPGEDVLTAVLGPEHPGRTRGVGHTIGLKQTIAGISGRKRKSRISEDIDFEQKKADFDEIYKEKVRLIDAHFDERKRIFIAEIEEMKSKHNDIQMKSNHTDIHDGSLSLRSGKSAYGSVPCLDEFDDIQLPAPCDLLAVEGDYKFPCAKGMVHSIGNGLCHFVPVKADYVKVHVDQVSKTFVNFPLPLPNEEMKEPKEC